jgi:hypothetical protein
MKQGEMIRVLMLHRNIIDCACDHYRKKAKKYKKNTLSAQNFFEPISNTYFIKTSDAPELKGTLIDDGQKDENFEFHVEVMQEDRYWYPLKNGELPIREIEQEGFIAPYPEPHEWRIDWVKRNGRIGMRGPMIVWSKLAKYPDLRLP